MKLLKFLLPLLLVASVSSFSLKSLFSHEDNAEEVPAEETAVEVVDEEASEEEDREEEESEEDELKDENVDAEALEEQEDEEDEEEDGHDDEDYEDDSEYYTDGEEYVDDKGHREFNHYTTLEEAKEWWKKLSPGARKKIAEEEYIKNEEDKRFQIYLKALILEAEKIG